MGSLRPSSHLRSIARETSPAVPLAAIERIGAIALGPLDYLVGNGDGEAAAGVDVTAVVNACPDARLRGPFP